MNFHLTRRVIATAALVAAAGGGTSAVAWAASSSSSAPPILDSGRISGCYNSGTGKVTVLTPTITSCGAKTPISWVGQQLNAVVFSDGTLLHGYGAASVSHSAGTGIYVISFSYTGAGACAQVAGLADMTPGIVSAYGGQGPANTVQVQTSDVSGNPADRTFQLVLAC
jgi:hypothetical protein